MKLYIAGRYFRRDEFAGYRTQLEELGLEVTSRWLEEKHAIDIKHTSLPESENAGIALKDMEDVFRANAMLFFAEEAYNQPPRGGRHVEFGAALALGKRVFVVGDKENVFHHLPGIKHYKSFEEFIQDGRNFN